MGLSVAGFSLWAIGDACFKHLGSKYDTIPLIVFNSVFSIAILVLFSGFLGGLRTVFKTPYLKFHFLRGTIFFCNLTLIIYGMTHMSLAKTYAILFLTPFIICLLGAMILKEKMGTTHILATLCGFAGVLIVLRPGFVPMGLPALALMLNAVLFAVSQIIARHIGSQSGGETLIQWAMLPEIPRLALALIPFSLAPVMPEGSDILIIMATSLINISGIVLVSLAMTKAAAGIVAPFHYAQMLWAIVLGYFIFGDMLDLWTGLGAAVIIGSGLWLIVQQNRKTVSVVPA